MATERVGGGWSIRVPAPEIRYSNPPRTPSSELNEEGPCLAVRWSVAPSPAKWEKRGIERRAVERRAVACVLPCCARASKVPEH